MTNTMTNPDSSFWSVLAQPADRAAPLDYDSIAYDADTWFVSPDAQMMIAKEDDYDYPLWSVGEYVSKVSEQVSNLLGRPVSPGAFLNQPLAIAETDTYAQVAPLSLVLWLERIDWDETTVERVRATLSAPHLKDHLDLFQYGLRDLGIVADRVYARGADRDKLKRVLQAHEWSDGWAEQFRDLNAEQDLSRACADMALMGIEAHWSHNDDLYRAAALAYARTLNTTT